jgi:hypothetical protein
MKHPMTASLLLYLPVTGGEISTSAFAGLS